MNAKNIAQEFLNRRGVTTLANTQEDEQPEHKHEWDLLSKTYATARRDLPSDIGSLEEEIADRILFGATVFLWECLVCRTLRKEQVLGSDVTQLDELIDKADKYGAQYIQRTDGVTFVLAKYNPPQTASTLPMR